MKLCAWHADGSLRRGAVVGGAVIDLGLTLGRKDDDALLGRNADDVARAHALIATASAPRDLADVALAAPVLPGNFFACGLNYADHAREMGRPLPDRPSAFSKPRTSITGPTDPIPHPQGVTSLDYEGELGIVIGRRCRNVPSEDARSVICGYLVVNDLSVREWLAPDRLLLAKGCDGFAPCGPWITTADAIEPRDGLWVRTWVDGELRQDSSTSQMIFSIDYLVAEFSRGITLMPGDIISTGSPPGSGAGFKPPRFLKPGQLVEVEIEGLGRIANRVVESAGDAND